MKTGTEIVNPPVTYTFKGHAKAVKIYILKFNATILNRHKIKRFLKIQSKNINNVAKFITILRN